MLKFQIRDGQATYEKWRWADYKDADDVGLMRLELYQPDVIEHMKMASRFRLREANPDWPGFVTFVAKEWFRNFEGAVDTDGQPLPNTPEIRELMLRQNDPLLGFIIPFFRSIVEQTQEGNAGSGSV